MECSTLADLPPEWLYLIFDHCNTMSLICLKQLNKRFKEYVTDYLKINKPHPYPYIKMYRFRMFVQYKYMYHGIRIPKYLTSKKLNCFIKYYESISLEDTCKRFIRLFCDFYRNHDSCLGKQTFWNRINAESLSYSLTINYGENKHHYNRCFLIEDDNLLEISIKLTRTRIIRTNDKN